MKCYKDLVLDQFRKKCFFDLPGIKFLGHNIDGDGILPLTEKIKAIQDFSTPASNNYEVSSEWSKISTKGLFWIVQKYFNP